MYGPNSGNVMRNLGVSPTATLPWLLLGRADAGAIAAEIVM